MDLFQVRLAHGNFADAEQPAAECTSAMTCQSAWLGRRETQLLYRLTIVLQGIIDASIQELQVRQANPGSDNFQLHDVGLRSLLREDRVVVDSLMKELVAQGR